MMCRQAVTGIALSAGALLLAAGCAGSPTVEDAQEEVSAASSSSAMSNDATTMDVHLAYIIPGSDALFAAEGEPPETDAQWAATQAAARKVIDGANLLMIGNRPPGSSDWMMHAGKVVEATKVTAAALDGKNADELVFTNGDMMDGCTACHLQFRQR